MSGYFKVIMGVPIPDHLQSEEAQNYVDTMEQSEFFGLVGAIQSNFVSEKIPSHCRNPQDLMERVETILASHRCPARVEAFQFDSVNGLCKIVVRSSRVYAPPSLKAVRALRDYLHSDILTRTVRSGDDIYTGLILRWGG